MVDSRVARIPAKSPLRHASVCRVVRFCFAFPFLSFKRGSSKARRVLIGSNAFSKIQRYFREPMFVYKSSVFLCFASSKTVLKFFHIKVLCPKPFNFCIKVPSYDMFSNFSVKTARAQNPLNVFPLKGFVSENVFKCFRPKVSCPTSPRKQNIGTKFKYYRN